MDVRVLRVCYEVRSGLSMELMEREADSVETGDEHNEAELMGPTLWNRCPSPLV